MEAIKKCVYLLPSNERANFIAELANLVNKSKEEQKLSIQHLTEYYNELKPSSMWLDHYTADMDNKTIVYIDAINNPNKQHYILKVKEGIDPNIAFGKYDEYRGLPNRKKFIQPIYKVCQGNAKVCTYLENYFELAN